METGADWNDPTRRPLIHGRAYTLAELRMGMPPVTPQPHVPFELRGFLLICGALLDYENDLRKYASLPAVERDRAPGHPAWRWPAART